MHVREKREVTPELRATLRDIAARSTPVVAWYPHPYEVRGPFGRWFTCTGGDNGMRDGTPTPVANVADDCTFAAAAMNTLTMLLDEIDRLEAKLKGRIQLKTVDERYREDSAFRHLVDMLHALIGRSEFTPSEIREAALFAQMKWELFNPRPVTMSSGLWDELDRIRHRAEQCPAGNPPHETRKEKP